MKSFMPKALFYYSALASIFITVSIISTSQTLIPVIFAVLFLPVTSYFVIEFFRKMRGELSDTDSKPIKGEGLVIAIIFALLTGLGLRNIYIRTQATPTVPLPQTTSSPLIFLKSPTPEPQDKIEVSITDGSRSVNIRKLPTIYSQKVAEAKNGDIFPYSEKANGWYKISLADGSFGFISSKYTKEVEAK